MDMDTIISNAKEIILELGEFPTTFFVEIDQANMKGLAFPQYDEAESSYEKAKFLFHAGRNFGKALKKHKVTGLCEVGEIWMGAPGMRPSLNPNRKEGLQIHIIDVQTLKQSALVYEMIRDGSGKLVDLLASPWNDDKTELYGMALPAFLAGIRTAKQDYSLASHELRRIHEKYMALISAAQNAYGSSSD